MIKILFATLLISSPSLADSNMIRVGIADTGLAQNTSFKVPLCDDGHVDFTTIPSKNEIGNDTHGHGTHVAGIVHQRATDTVLSSYDSRMVLDRKIENLNLETETRRLNYCLVIYKAVDEKSNFAYVEFLNYMKKNPKAVDILNLSVTGKDRINLEVETIKKLISSGTKVVVAAGNHGMELSKKKQEIYPAQVSDDVIVVGSYVYPDVGGVETTIKEQNRVSSSNFGEVVDFYMPGYDIYSNGIKNSMGSYGLVQFTGTSQAAPGYAGLLVKKMMEEMKGGMCVKRTPRSNR